MAWIDLYWIELGNRLASRNSCLCKYRMLSEPSSWWSLILKWNLDLCESHAGWCFPPARCELVDSFTLQCLQYCHGCARGHVSVASEKWWKFSLVTWAHNALWLRQSQPMFRPANHKRVIPANQRLSRTTLTLTDSRTASRPRLCSSLCVRLGRCTMSQMRGRTSSGLNTWNRPALSQLDWGGLLPTWLLGVPTLPGLAHTLS